MVVLNYTGEEINAKIVYYGPGLSGKTTNLEYLYGQMPADSKGQMVSMKTRTDRTLFFDFFPLELGEINGYRTRFLLYTVPGQVYYNATRKLVLKGADALVFVADSAPDKLQENIESLRNLEDNLNEHGLSLDNIPWVIQYNKRDLSDCMEVSELHQHLNLMNVPAYEAIAMNGAGVYDTFKEIAGMLYRQLKEKLESGEVIASQSADGEDVMPRAPGEQPEDVNVAIDSALRELEGTGPAAPSAAPTYQPAEPAPGTPLATPLPPAPAEKPPHAVPLPPVPPVPAPPPQDPPIPGPVQSASPPTPPTASAQQQPPPKPEKPIRRSVSHPMDSARTLSQIVHGSRDAKQPPSQADHSSGDAAQPQSPVSDGSTDAKQPDNGFNFVPKDEKSSPDIGRLVELDEASDAPVADQDSESFITDPMRPSAAEESSAIEMQETPVVTEPKPDSSEQELVVPVVVSRSQVRKTIPLKLRLEIRIVDD
jgi:signal recognition particle receptor subunit beta